MNPDSDQPPLDARVAELAEAQYGAVTRQQLRDLGVGDTGIRERVRTRRLHRLHRGVYAVGHSVLPAKGHWMAAVLACGEGAALSHVAAAAHHQLRASSATLIDVTVRTRAGRRAPRGVRLHRSGRLSEEDVTVREGIPVTTVARTLLDLADVLSTQALTRVIAEADYLRLLDMTALIAVVERNPGRRGAKLLEAAAGPLELTRSALEERFLELVGRHGLPRPRAAVRIAGYEVDFYWPGAKLIVELDGFAAHGTRARFESDRRRDRALGRRGLRTIRLTATALTYEEDAIAEELAELLSRSRASSNPPSRSRVSDASAT
jgi:very-short-patch-repair endonuclease